MRQILKLVIFLAVVAVLGRAVQAQSFNLDQTSLNFSANAGTSPDPQQVNLFNLTINSLPISLHVTTQSGGRWLSASISPDPVPGNGQATITVSVNSSTLQPNNYNGTVTVSDGNGTSVDISVSLSVSGVTISAPSSVNASVGIGQQTQISIHVSGGPATVLISSSVPFLTPDAQVDAPGNFSVTVDASALGSGVHTGSLTLQCAGGGSPCIPLGIAVTVNVSQPTSLMANISALTFQAYQGRNDPSPQSLQIRTTDGMPLSFTFSTSQSWLNASVSNTTASSSPAIFTVTVSATGLSSGTNSGTINIQPSNGSAPVSIAVTATLSPFSILVSPNPFPPLTVGAGLTRSVAFQIGSADGSAVAVTITPQTDQGANWLQAPASINAPGQINVTVDATQLKVGNYTGSLTFSCTAITCAPVKVSISITVTTFASVLVTPTSLSFQPGPDNSLPSPQTVNLTASDQSSQSFAFSFVPQGSWLSVTANQSNTPATLTVSVVSIPAPNSIGSITVTPANGSPASKITVVFGSTPVIQPGGVITASSFGGFSSITSGTYMEIYGSNLSATTREWGGADFHGAQAPTMLDGVSATINGQSAFVRFISPGQVNLVVPDNIGTGPGQLILTTSKGVSAPYTVDIKATQPGLLAPLSFLIHGKQYVGATFADGSFVLPAGAVPGVKARPAKPGETIIFFGLGFGPVDPSVPAGTITQQLTKLRSPLQILFGQTPVTTISYEGLVPPYVGLYQFNLVVPLVADNDAVPVTFNIGGTAGSQILYIAVHH